MGSMEINIRAKDKYINAKAAEDHLWHKYKKNIITDVFIFCQKITEH